MTLDQEFAQYQGQSVLVPGSSEADRGQCFMWFDFVLHDVYGLPYFYAPGAIDIWENPGWLLDHFDKITDGSVKKGDFVVFNTQVGSQFGHVDVAMADGTVGNFQGSDSNWGGNLTVHLVQHSNSNLVLGSLRLKGVTMNDNITAADLDILRIIYACIEGGDFNATINDHTNDAFLEKNLTGSLRSAIRNMFANATSQAYQAQVQKALHSSGAVTKQSVIDYINGHLT